jgi:hypothetical protein
MSVTEQLRAALDVMRNNMDEVHNDIGGVVGYTLERLDAAETQTLWDALRDAAEAIRQLEADRDEWKRCSEQLFAMTRATATRLGAAEVG